MRQRTWKNRAGSDTRAEPKGKSRIHIPPRFPRLPLFGRKREEFPKGAP